VSLVLLAALLWVGQAGWRLWQGAKPAVLPPAQDIMVQLETQDAQGNKTGTEKDMRPENLKRLRFFEGLITVSNSRLPIVKNIKPDSRHSYLNAGGGRTGVHWRYEVSEHQTSAQFYLNHYDPKTNELVNKERYLFLFENKYEINEAFGEELDWNYQKNRKVQYIQSVCN
jgi:hypothetical protein